MPEWLTSKSKRTSYDFCHRKFAFDYILGLEGFIKEKRKDDMDIGKAFHDGSAYFHKLLKKKDDFWDVENRELYNYFESLLSTRCLEIPFFHEFLVSEANRLMQLRKDDREEIFLPIIIEDKFHVDELDVMGYVDRVYMTYDDEYCVQEIKRNVSSSWKLSGYRQECFFYKYGLDATSVLDKPIKYYHIYCYEDLPDVRPIEEFHWRTKEAFWNRMKEYRTGVASLTFDRSVSEHYSCNIKCEFFAVCWMDWQFPEEHPIIENCRRICKVKNWRYE